MLFFTFFVLFLYYIREKFTSRASASITAAYTIGAGLRKIPLTEPFSAWGKVLLFFMKTTVSYIAQHDPTAQTDTVV